MREDERRALAATERQLEVEDPELARRLRSESTDTSENFRIPLAAAPVLVLVVVCVVLGSWFAALQSLVLAAALIAVRHYRFI